MPTRPKSSETTAKTAVKTPPAEAPAKKKPGRRPVAKTAAEEAAAYERHKAAAAARSAAITNAGRELGPIPPVADPQRRAAAEASFQVFCETYLGETFNRPWSPDHLRVISKIEATVRHGGQYAMAMPRANGKTSLCEAGAEWAIVCGHRRFIALVGAEQASALEMLDSIKTEFESNELLLADFPEVLYPIHKLDGIVHRANGQLHQGKQTHITWTGNTIVLPMIPGSKAAGAIIKVAGITGRIRGMKYKRQDGASARPDLVIVDDPQTDESARSVIQVETREKVIGGAILGLAGPGKKIAGFCPCTVIVPGDLADRLLNRDLFPDWQGERTKLLYSFPARMDLWERYAELRKFSLREDRGITDATEFYREHRELMDAGAVVAWESRFEPGEISAVQNAMNLFFRNPDSFASEYQNEPLARVTAVEMLTAAQIAEKVNRRPQGEAPSEASHVTAFIDVQQNLLYWTAIAWEDNFSGYVLDYGAFPDQHRPFFTAANAQHTLQRLHPNLTWEAALAAGLETLASELLARDWPREDGATMRIERCLIDASWGASTEIVREVVRRNPAGGVLAPSHGRYVGATSIPFGEYKKKPGDRIGAFWRMPNAAGKKVRNVLFDANHWKSFVHARLGTTLGDVGSLSLFGANADRHAVFAEHLVAEDRVRVEAKGRVVDEWKAKPDRSENHYFDCVVGCAVGAAMLGCEMMGFTAPRKFVSTPIKLSSKQSATQPAPSAMQPNQRLRLSDIQSRRG